MTLRRSLRRHWGREQLTRAPSRSVSDRPQRGRGSTLVRVLGPALAACLTVGLLTGSSHALPSDLVAAYAFDAGSGSSVADASGNGNGGVFEGGVSWVASGKFGSALSFNGSNARVRVADAASLDLTSALTVEAWVYPAAAQQGWRTVVQKETDSYFLAASSDAGGLRPASGAAVGGALVYGRTGWREKSDCSESQTSQVGMKVTELARPES